jgi:hypothetical protein
MALSALGQVDRLHERLATVSRDMDGGWRDVRPVGRAESPKTRGSIARNVRRPYVGGNRR